MSAGKGDKPRAVDGVKYRANYDRIFMTEAKTKAKPVTKLEREILEYLRDHANATLAETVEALPHRRSVGFKVAGMVSAGFLTEDRPKNQSEGIILNVTRAGFRELHR